MQHKGARSDFVVKGIKSVESGNDSVARNPCTEETDHERLTLKPTYSAINIKRLKGFASEKLSGTSQLKDILLTEKDQLTVTDFLTKMDVWMRLLNIELTDLLV